MTRPVIAEPCAFPGDLSRRPSVQEALQRPALVAAPCPGDVAGDDDFAGDVDLIRWDGPCSFTCRGAHGHIFINGYRCALQTPLTLEGLATDVLGVVLDPVPEHLITPFAEQVIALRGPSWVMLSTDVLSWIFGHTGRLIHMGVPISRADDARISRDGP